MEMQTNTETKTMTAIERALAAAKARKAAKGDASEDAAPPPARAPKAKGEKPTDESRAAARAEREVQRAARAAAKAAEAEAKAAAKAQREADRAAKKAAASTQGKAPAHMKKVERARAKCPPLGTEAERIFGEITANFSAGQIDAIAQHLLVHNRAAATVRACSVPPLTLGATVRITGGEAKFVGAIGTVVHSQKLRAKVSVPGVTKPVYIYNGQAEELPAAAAAVG